MNHVPYHELARADRAQRLGLPADPEALAILLTQQGLLRDVALDDVTEERDILADCHKEAHVAEKVASAALRRADALLVRLRDALAMPRLSRDALRALSENVSDELENISKHLAEIRLQTQK